MSKKKNFKEKADKADKGAQTPQEDVGKVTQIPDMKAKIKAHKEKLEADKIKRQKEGKSFRKENPEQKAAREQREADKQTKKIAADQARVDRQKKSVARKEAAEQKSQEAAAKKVQREKDREEKVLSGAAEEIVELQGQLKNMKEHFGGRADDTKKFQGRKDRYEKHLANLDPNAAKDSSAKNKEVEERLETSFKNGVMKRQNWVSDAEKALVKAQERVENEKGKLTSYTTERREAIDKANLKRSETSTNSIYNEDTLLDRIAKQELKIEANQNTDEKHKVLITEKTARIAELENMLKDTGSSPKQDKAGKKKTK